MDKKSNRLSGSTIKKAILVYLGTQTSDHSITVNFRVKFLRSKLSRKSLKHNKILKKQVRRRELVRTSNRNK